MPVKPIPDGHHTVTPYLLVKNVPHLIDFLKSAFGAKEDHRMVMPDGRVSHAQVTVGDSKLMMGEVEGDWKAMPAAFYLYVPDADATYKQAMAAGAKSISEPKDEFYGDRVGGVSDASGNMWWMATHKEDVSGEELAKRGAAAAAHRKGK